MPINNSTFIYHMRAVLESNNKLNKLKSNKDLWSKVKNEALRRYHPDKFNHNFEKCLTSEEDKELIMRQINEIWKVLNTQFKF